MKNRLFTIIGIILAINARLTSEENTWKKLRPLEHYDVDQFTKIMKDKTDLEIVPLRIGAFFFVFRIPEKEPNYSIPKNKRDSIRLLVSLELNSEKSAVLLDSACIDTCSKDFPSDIIYDGMNLALQVRDEKGRNYLLISGARIENIVTENLCGIDVTCGAFDKSVKTMLNDADLYFWDKNTKKIWCYKNERSQFIDTCNYIDKPVFFYEETERKYKKLYVAESEKSSPRFDSVWECTAQDLRRVK